MSVSSWWHLCHIAPSDTSQFLSSVISSINEGKPASPAPTPKPNPPVRKAAAAPNAAQPASSNGAIKRKSEESGNDLRVKVARVDLNGNSATPSRSATSSPALKAGVPPPKAQVPYRGTTRPSVPSGPSVPSPVPVSSTSKSITAAPVTKPPAPAKSGYLATLERAKAAQEAAKQIGLIKHKPVEKISRRERLQREAEAAAQSKATSGKNGKQTPRSRSTSAAPTDPKGANAAERRRKPVEVGYKGTMRPTAAPKEPSYRGTMGGPGGVSRKALGSEKADTGRYGGSSSKNRYEDYSDEEEDIEEDVYESDLSDMEAGLDDLDEEELMSAKIARKEDEEALREENELKRQKLERKRKLQQMASAAAKAKKRY